MRAGRQFLFPLLILFNLFLLPSYADEAKPYFDNSRVDLVKILPPPPLADSELTKKELADMEAMQKTRTPAQAERAIADNEETIWRYADVVDNAKFTKENLPKIAVLFDRVHSTAVAIVRPSKDVFKRLRPQIADTEIKTLVTPSTTGSWPSGHATVGTMMAIILSEMLPEKRTAIMVRNREYGDNRVLAGMHYPSDVEVGRIGGSVVAYALLQDADFQKDYQEARTELRNTLYGAGQ